MSLSTSGYYFQLIKAPTSFITRIFWLHIYEIAELQNNYKKIEKLNMAEIDDISEAIVNTLIL